MWAQRVGAPPDPERDPVVVLHVGRRRALPLPGRPVVTAALTITVHGIPAPQGSKRHVGGGRMVESSKAVGPWREAVRHETQQAMRAQSKHGHSGPVSVRVIFTLPRPQAHLSARGGLRPSAPEHHIRRPDLDKLARAVMDGLTSAGAYCDDAQVVELDARKTYGSPTGCHITITPL